MTMDVSSRVSVSINNPNRQYSKESKPEESDEDRRSPNEQTNHNNSNFFDNMTVIPKRTNQKTKRSFDVAFLITPDEKMVRKQAKEDFYNSEYQFKQQIYAKNTPENLIMVEKKCEDETESIKSAFRKVGLQKTVEMKYSQSPVSSISGSYQESRSPSPNSLIDPVRTPSPQFTRQEIYPVMSNFPNMDFFLKQKQEKQESMVKPQSPYFYPFSNFPRQLPEICRAPQMFGNMAVRHNFLPNTNTFGNNIFTTTQLPLAASLLPSSIAALTLPAQNVCAKCNVSFRMTSDLVYHMRSHHKNEHASSDALRRKRELDKLRCPVCNESFRERHHLTRHMTAHQDKESDKEEDGEGKGFKLKNTKTLLDFEK